MSAHNSYNPLYAILDVIPKEGILLDPKLMEFMATEFSKSGYATLQAFDYFIKYLVEEAKVIELYTIKSALYIRKTYG